MNLLLCRFVAGGCIITRQCGEVLAEAVAGSKAVVAGLVEVAQRRPTIPSAHIFSGSGKAGALAKWLEQAVFIEGAIEGVVGVELLTERALEQFDIAVGKLIERGRGVAVSGGSGERTA